MTAGNPSIGSLIPSPHTSGDDAAGALRCGRHYRVEHSDNLTAWSTLEDNIPGTGTTVRITHAGAHAAPRHFYRVVVLD